MTDPIFLDFQATTPLDERVMEAMLPWLRRPANPHSVQNTPGRAAAEAVAEAQAQVALSVGRRAEDVIFTSGATFACNLVLRSFAKPNARIVVSAIEHPCVLETVRWCENQGAQLDIIPVNDDGVVDLDQACELADGADLVSLMAINNEVGTMQPISELAAYCEGQGTIFHSDAAQALGRMDLAELPENVILTLSSHKAYGPQGVGAICASPETITSLKPLVIGGGQQGGLHAGTLPTALCVGFGAAATFAHLEREADWLHARELSDLFVERLESRGVSFSVNGSTHDSVPHNLNLSFENTDADALLGLLPDVALATGSACSSGAIGKSRVLRAMGLSDKRVTGAVRIGFGRSSTAEDIDEAAGRIAAALQRLEKDL